MLNIGNKFKSIGYRRLKLVKATNYFWGWSKDEKIHDNEQGGTGSNENKQLVANFGENSPKPSQVLLLPVRRPIFPGFMAATFVKDEKTIEAIVTARDKGSGYLGVALRTDYSIITDIDTTPELITGLDELYKVGTFVQIQNIIRTQNSIQLLLMAHRQ
eukprot:gene4500-5951_t